MSGLQKFEQRLEALVSGAFARAFRSAVQPVEIAAALQRECDNNTQILSRERRMVPNDFHVELSQPDMDRLHHEVFKKDYTLRETPAVAGWIANGLSVEALRRMPDAGPALVALARFMGRRSARRDARIFGEAR